MNETISKFFDERKEAWIKKNLKSSMEEDEVLELYEMDFFKNSISIWEFKETFFSLHYFCRRSLCGFFLYR